MEALDGDPWPWADNDYYGTWTEAKTFREIRIQLHEQYPETVFFTSARKVYWGHTNRNYDVNDTTGYFGDYSYWISPYQSNGAWPPMGPHWTVIDCGYNGGSRQPCLLVGNYMLRPQDTTSYSYNSFKMDRVQGKAIASDAIWGWPWRTYERQTPWLLVAWNREDMLVTRHFYANHDMAYNVLFTDGSVKTFSDAGGSLMTELRKTQINNNGSSPSLYQISTLYRTYFDSLYAQD
jgi:hypothetical protein